MTARPGEAERPISTLTRRVHALLIFRVLLASLLTLLAITLAHLDPRTTLTVAAAYLALTIVCSLGVHTHHPLIAERTLAATLAVDVVSLTAVRVYLEGVPSLSVALVVNLIAVSLLTSISTGLIVAAWQSLAVAATPALAAAGAMPMPPASATSATRVITDLAMIWLVVGTTGIAGAVSERELNRRRYDAEALAGFAARLHQAERPEDVLDHCLRFVVEELNPTRAITIVESSRGITVQGCYGPAPADHLISLQPGELALMPRSLLTRTPDAYGLILAKELDATFDPWLAALLPQGRRIIVMALADGEHHRAWVVFEHGARRDSRVARRLLSTAGQATTTAQLALSRAELLTRARRAAATDGLTGVFNRASLDTYLSEWQTDGQAHGPDGVPLALVLVDADHFKAVNDTFGHQAGDAALRHLAHLLQAQTRDRDMVARYGGEEFVVILPGADAMTAAHRAEQIRQVLVASPVAWAETTIALTASFGVAAAPEHGHQAADLLAAADAALYTAKSAGRNRVVVATTNEPSEAFLVTQRDG